MRKNLCTNRKGKSWRKEINDCRKRLYIRCKTAVGNEDGLGTIELVLLICVLIALALMFKDTIVEFVEDILGNISSQETVFDPGTIAK